MPERSYEFAVFGSTPFARLLAGLLATEHHKRVVMVDDGTAGFRLPTGIDLSAMPATRPETWALLKETVPEVTRLIGRLRGRAGLQRVDPIFVAETREGAEALSHVRHLALAFGHDMMPLPEAGSYRLRGAVLLHRAPLEATLASWLDKAGVGRLAARDAGVTIKRDGSVRLDFRGVPLEAAHAVLADDAAILACLDVAERDRTLQPRSVTALLTERTRPLAAPVMAYIDRDVTLMRGRGEGILGLSSGPSDRAVERIGGCLAGRGPLRRAGQRICRAIGTVDGAPLVGTAKGVRATLVVGLGLSAAFFAPAVARLLAGSASPGEKSYFAARETGRGGARALVAEFAAGEPAAAAMGVSG